MEIKQNKVDELNLELTISVVKEDYIDARKKRLSDFRKKADIKGFRKGMVPMALVEKMYGHSATADSVNDVISESLNNFIKENNLKVIGEPLPSEEQPNIDWMKDENFTFTFDVALYPEINIELGKDDEVPAYTITVTAEAKAEMKKNILKQFGSLEEGEKAGEEDFIVADFEQGETKVEGTYVALRSVAEAVKPAFVGVKVGDVLNVNVNEAFENEADRASMLKVKKEELASMDPEFKMTVVNVKTFVDAPETQETFDKVFGEGVVNSVEEFDKKIQERLAAEYAQESDFRIQKDMKDYVLAKADVKLPEAFLKRWLFFVNDGKFTMEDIEKDFAPFCDDFRWQLVREYLMDKYSVKVEQEDLLASAKGFAAYQYAMYGINNVPDEQLEEFAKSILSNEKESRRVVEQVENEKVVAALKDVVTLKKKKISVEKFRNL